MPFLFTIDDFVVELTNASRRFSMPHAGKMMGIAMTKRFTDSEPGMIPSDFDVLPEAVPPATSQHETVTHIIGNQQPLIKDARTVSNIINHHETIARAKKYH